MDKKYKINKQTQEPTDTQTPEQDAPRDAIAIFNEIKEILKNVSVQDKRIVMEMMQAELKADKKKSTFAITIEKDGIQKELTAGSAADLARSVIFLLYPSLEQLGKKVNPARIFFGRDTHNWQSSINFLETQLRNAGYNILKNK